MLDITFPPKSTFYTPTVFLLSACLAFGGCSSARRVEAERSFRSDTHLFCDTLAARSARDAAASIRTAAASKAKNRNPLLASSSRSRSSSTL